MKNLPDPDCKKKRQHDFVLTLFLAVFLLLNCGVFDYSSLLFGLVKYRAAVNFAVGVLLLIFLRIFRIRKEIRPYDRYFRKPLLWVLALYCTVFVYDFSRVLSDYQNTALPSLLSQILVILAVYLLLPYGVYDLQKFLLRMQVVLGLVALIVCVQYFFPGAVFPGDFTGGWITAEEGVRRYTHTAYHLAMVSFFITSFQMFSRMMYRKIETAFLTFNFFLQSVSILVANYRATMILSFLFVFLSLFWFFVIGRNGVRRLRGILCFALFMSLFVLIFSVQFDWFHRVREMGPIFTDENMIYRFNEIKEGMTLLKSPSDYLFGVGYIRFFYFYKDTFKTFFLHNGFVSVLFNFGIVGCLIVLNLLFRLFLGIYRKFHGTRRELFYISVGYLLVLLGQNFSSGIFTREPSALLGFGIFILVLKLQDSEPRCPRSTAEAHLG